MAVIVARILLLPRASTLRQVSQAGPLRLQSMATERKSGAMASYQGQLGRPAVCAYLAALAAALAGCSASDLTPATAIDLPQPNYRRVVADNAKVVIPNVGSVGDLEISGVRLVDHLKGPAWLTCLKVDAHGKPQNYALFIQGDRIIDSRIGIVIDQCYKQTFEPFDLPPPPAAKKVGP
jgi:hypothetical protein